MKTFVLLTAFEEYFYIAIPLLLAITFYSVTALNQLLRYLSIKLSLLIDKIRYSEVWYDYYETPESLYMDNIMLDPTLNIPKIKKPEDYLTPQDKPALTLSKYSRMALISLYNNLKNRDLEKEDDISLLLSAISEIIYRYEDLKDKYDEKMIESDIEDYIEYKNLVFDDFPDYIRSKYKN